MVKSFIRDTKGMAVVEASILLPVILMIFSGLALASMYLPIRSALQRATQIAATAIATEGSDAWVFYNEGKMEYYWGTRQDVDFLKGNVYASFFRRIGTSLWRAGEIAINAEANGISARFGRLEIHIEPVNHILYKEIKVTAVRTIPMMSGVDLAFVRFPRNLEIWVSSTAVVPNGDEFVRNMDLAVDFLDNFWKVSGSLERLAGMSNRVFGLQGGN
jgi:hypothetical protein